MKKVGHTLEFPFAIHWWTSKNPKNQTFEKMKKISRDIILHMCTKKHNHMKYSSQDTEWDRIFYDFGPFPALLPPTPTRKQHRKPKFWKNEKTSGDVIILNLCNKKHHMMYAYWDMECDRHNCHFRPFFALLTHYWPRKLKSWKKCNKNLDILSFYTCVP